MRTSIRTPGSRPSTGCRGCRTRRSRASSAFHQRFEVDEGDLRIVEGWHAQNPGAEEPAVLDDGADYRVTVRAATNLDSAIANDVDLAFVAFDLED